MTRVLIVNADDFGRAAAMNAGVAVAHERGIVNSASLMVRWSAALAAAEYARAQPELSVGLHVDVGEWAYKNGGWSCEYDVVAEDDEAESEQEVRRQLDTFRKLCGIDPTHLDSHQHAHQNEPLGGVLGRLAAELEVPLRHAGPVQVHTGFYGQTSRGFTVHDRISVVGLVGWLDVLPEGITELVCHPAVSGDVPGNYREERALELATLCDPEVRDAIERRGIELRQFRQIDVGPVATPPSEARVAASVTVVSEPQASAGARRREWIGATAEARWARGDLRAALRELDELVDTNAPDVSLLHWRDLAKGEIRVLSGAWSGSIAERRVVPTPGRILHIVGASLPYGHTGYSIRTGYVAEAQQRVGLDPHVVTPLGYPDGRGVPAAGREEQVGGIPHYRLPTADGIPERLDARLSLTVRLVADLAERLRPAVIHAASDYENALVALEVGRAIDVPVVYEVRGFWEETQRVLRGPDWYLGDEYRWRRERELQCCGAVDQVVTLAESMRAELVNRGVTADKITVVPNGVDVDRFVPVTRDADLAARLGFDRGQLVLGYVSSLTAYEGVRYLLHAIADLVQRGHDVRGLIVGDGAERAQLVEGAASLGIADRVVFTGRVPREEVLRYYSLIDVFVAPRTADRVSQLVTPLKPFEAMAAARAVVVSRVEALREIVQDGITGLTFEPEDAQDLASVLEPLIHNAERRRALGLAARRWVCEHRTWQQVGERYRRLYESMGLLDGAVRASVAEP